MPLNTKMSILTISKPHIKNGYFDHFKTPYLIQYLTKMKTKARILMRVRKSTTFILTLLDFGLRIKNLVLPYPFLFQRKTPTKMKPWCFHFVLKRSFDPYFQKGYSKSKLFTLVPLMLFCLLAHNYQLHSI